MLAVIGIVFIIFPMDVSPTISICAGILAIIIAIVIISFMIKKRNDNKNYIQVLLNEANRYMELANKSKSISVFMQSYTQLLQTLQGLQQFESTFKFNGSPTEDYSRITQEKQRYLQKALEREFYYKLEDKMNLETNYEQFCKEVEYYRNDFSNETLNIAEEYKNKLFSELTRGIDNNPKNLLNDVLTFEQLVEKEMLDIDLMHYEGWKFEQYCAELLLNNGFSATEVTQKSNDYGVDIIAINPDGVRYAIQCKCYSNKLGNTPIQEIVAGMKVYNCQVGVVLTNNYFTNNAHILAQNNGIILWDRDKLKHMVETSKKQEFSEKNIKVPIVSQNTQTDVNEYDILLQDAIELAKNKGYISTSIIQCRLAVGYSRASRIIDQMENMGVISKANGSKPREFIG